MLYLLIINLVCYQVKIFMSIVIAFCNSKYQVILNTIFSVASLFSPL